MKKFFKAIASTMVFTMFLAACGSSGPAPIDPSDLSLPSEEEEVTIRVSWWGSDARHEAMQEVAALYMEQNPNVTVLTEHGAWTGWQAKILTQLSGSAEPDVMQVNYAWVHSFGRGQNVFYDLNELTDFIDLSYWTPSMLESMTVGGELAAVPHGMTGRINVYNKELFNEYGIDYPTTYDELIEAGHLIAANNTPTGADNQYVITNIGRESTDLFLATMLYNETGKPMQVDGVVQYTVEEVATVLDRYKSFEDAGAVPTFQQDDPIQNESNPVWTGGRSGSVFEWVGTMDKYTSTFKGGNHEHELSVAPFITENGDGGSLFVKPSLGYAVSRNSQHPAVAADFINFMFTDEEAIMILGSTLGISSHALTMEIQEREGLIEDAMLEGLELFHNSTHFIMDPYFEDENVRGARLIAIEAFRTGSMDSTEAATLYIESQQKELDDLGVSNG